MAEHRTCQACGSPYLGQRNARLPYCRPCRQQIANQAAKQRRRQEKLSRISAAAEQDPRLLVDYDPRPLYAARPKRQRRATSAVPRQREQWQPLTQRERERQELLKALREARRNDSKRKKGA